MCLNSYVNGCARTNRVICPSVAQGFGKTQRARDALLGTGQRAPGVCRVRYCPPVSHRPYTVVKLYRPATTVAPPFAGRASEEKGRLPLVS